MTNNTKIIELYDITSYPPDILNIFNEYETLFDQLESIHNNEYWYERDEFCQLLTSHIHFDLTKAVLDNMYYFVFYHISKLLDYEVEEMLKSGFLQVNEDSIRKKIEMAYNYEKITEVMRDILISNSAVASQNPSGSVYFYYTKSGIVKDILENGMVINTLWGGESIAWSFKDNPIISEELRKIGDLNIVRFYVHQITHWQLETVVNIMIMAYVSHYYNISFPSQHFVTSNTSSSTKILSIDSFYKYVNTSEN